MEHRLWCLQHRDSQRNTQSGGIYQDGLREVTLKMHPKTFHPQHRSQSSWIQQAYTGSRRRTQKGALSLTGRTSLVLGILVRREASGKVGPCPSPRSPGPCPRTATHGKNPSRKTGVRCRSWRGRACWSVAAFSRSLVPRNLLEGC